MRSMTLMSPSFPPGGKHSSRLVYIRWWWLDTGYGSEVIDFVTELDLVKSVYDAYVLMLISL